MARGTLRTVFVGLLVGVFTLLVLAVVLPVVFVGLLLVGTTAPWLLATSALLVVGHAATGGTIAGYLRAGRRLDDALVGALAAALVFVVVGFLLGLFGTLVVFGFATVPIERPMALLGRYSLIAAAVGGVGGCALGGLGGLAGRRLRRARREGDGRERGAATPDDASEPTETGTGNGSGAGNGVTDGTGSDDDADEPASTRDRRR